MSHRYIGNQFKKIVQGVWVGMALLTLNFGAQAAEEQILDNGTAQFSVVGEWPVSTAISGYYGSNYQPHAANGPVLGAIVVDNEDVGFSVTGEWRLSTAIKGYYGSNYQPHEANGAKPGSVLTDNSSGSATGTWASSTAVSGYEGSNYQTHAAGTGSNQFTWSLAGSGEYKVYARWTAHANRASNAKYTITHQNGTQTVTVSQKENGGSWQLLGTYTLDASSNISLSDEANGYVIADAVMAEPVDAKASTATWALPITESKAYKVYARWSAYTNRATNAQYVVTHSAGQTATPVNQQENGGSWQLLGTYTLDASSSVSLSDEADGYVIADAVMAVPEDAPNANTATWTPTLSGAGVYEVYARWSEHPNRATDAKYTITHQDGAETITVNQQENGGTWQLLGTYTLNATSNISLSDEANGYVIADAIRLVKVGSTAAQLYYIHPDHLNTPRMITNETNTAVWRWDSDPFGATIPNDTISGTTFTFNQRFPGQYFDKETNLHYNYFRDYDPTLGRYIQSDPIGLNGGLNTYSYVDGNPIIYVDPNGLSSITFNQATKSINVYDKDGKFKFSCPAGNNLTKKAQANWPDGRWTSGDYGYSYYKPHSESGATGPYGSHGIHIFDVPGHSGVGVHSGRNGPESKTEGCVRTTDPCMELINKLHDSDPLRQITIKDK